MKIRSPEDTGAHADSLLTGHCFCCLILSPHCSRLPWEAVLGNSSVMSLFAPSPGQILFLPLLGSQSRATVRQMSQPVRPGPCQPCPGPHGPPEGTGQTSCASAGAAEGRGVAKALLWTPEPRPGGGILWPGLSRAGRSHQEQCGHGDWVTGGLFRQSGWR